MDGLDGVERRNSASSLLVGHATMTASTGRRGDQGICGPQPKRMTISGLLSGIPTKAASSGLRRATSTGWLIKACFSPSAVACSAKRWQARPVATPMRVVCLLGHKHRNSGGRADLAGVFVILRLRRRQPVEDQRPQPIGQRRIAGRRTGPCPVTLGLIATFQSVFGSTACRPPPW